MLTKLKSIAKSVVKGIQQRRRVAQIKSSADPITESRLRVGFTSLGLMPGDVVMLHSSLKSLGYVEGGPAAVLNALLEAISPGGTLVVPTYYQPGGTILATCQMDNYFFDPRIHGTSLGSLPAAFLKVPGVERSIHPTHSVSAVGPQAQYIVKDHHFAASTFGAGSPWQRCIELDAKILGLGVSMGPVTFYHALEDAVLDNFPLPVRSRRSYRLLCKDAAGQAHFVGVTPFDPQYMDRRIDAPGRGDLRAFFWKEFESAGLMTIGQVGQATAWYIRAKAFYDHLHALMAQGVTIYSTTDEIARHTAAVRR